MRYSRDQLSSTFEGFTPRKLPWAGRRAAAITIPVLLVEDRPAIWITRRAAGLRSHAGQYAFPGGRVDLGETLADAALRELYEELGVATTPNQIIGELDDFATKSGYVITPFVVWLGAFAGAPQANPDEVAGVHTVDFDELDVEPQFVHDPAVETPVVQIPFRDIDLYAPTAAIWYQFRELVLHRRHTRVVDFGQPVFAWQ